MTQGKLQGNVGLVATDRGEFEVWERGKRGPDSCHYTHSLHRGHEGGTRQTHSHKTDGLCFKTYTNP